MPRCIASTAAFSVLLLVLTGVPAAPQATMADPGSERAMEDQGASSDGPDSLGRSISTSLEKCFLPAIARSDISPASYVRVRFRTDAQANVRGRPRLIEPKYANADERRLFRVTVEAIESCELAFDDGPIVAVLTVHGSGITTTVRKPSAVNVGALRSGSDISMESADRASSSNGGSTPVDRGMESTVSRATSGPEVVATDPVQQEAALGLSLPQRREIQRRLSVIGFDPRGVDGVFGPRTRAAISSWQQSNSLPPTGYLSKDQLARLEVESADKFAAWRSDSDARSDQTGTRGNRVSPDGPAAFFGTWRLVAVTSDGRKWISPPWGIEILKISGNRNFVITQPTTGKRGTGKWEFNSNNETIFMSQGRARNTLRIVGKDIIMTDRKGRRYRYVRRE